MELKRVVRTQTDIQPYFKKIRQGIPLIRQEQGIIAQWAHSDANLFQIK